MQYSSSGIGHRPSALPLAAAYVLRVVGASPHPQRPLGNGAVPMATVPMELPRVSKSSAL